MNALESGELASLVNRHGIKAVVAQLAIICGDEAYNSGPSWVGQANAIEWRRASRLLERAAFELTVED